MWCEEDGGWNDTWPYLADTDSWWCLRSVGFMGISPGMTDPDPPGSRRFPVCEVPSIAHLRSCGIKLPDVALFTQFGAYFLFVFVSFYEWCQNARYPSFAIFLLDHIPIPDISQPWSLNQQGYCTYSPRGPAAAADYTCPLLNGWSVSREG